MLDNTLVCDSAAHLGKLEKAFSAFNRLASDLQSSYQTLQQRVARLTSELEDARRASQNAAAEAQRTAERLRSVLATLPRGVVVVDDSGRIQEHNRIAAEILGSDLVGAACEAHAVECGAGWLAQLGFLPGVAPKVKRVTGVRLHRQRDVVERGEVEEQRRDLERARQAEHAALIGR